MSDATFKVSEATFVEVLNKVYSKIPSIPFKGHSPNADDTKIKTDETTSGNTTSKTYLHVTVPWFGVEGAIHLKDIGGVEFNDDNTFLISELDIAWDKLKFEAGIDIPSMKFGGFCLIRVPDEVPIWGGDCAVYVPSFPLFTAEPDISITLDLSPIFGFIITEISAICSLDIRPGTDSGKPIWAIHGDPIAVDFDLVDIQDTLGQAPGLLAAAVALAALNLKATFPAAWLVDVFLDLLGLPSLTALVLDLLDIQDAVEEWLMKALKFSIGIDNLLTEVITDAILDSEPLYQVPNPIEITDDIKASAYKFGGFGPQGTDPTPPGDIEFKVLIPVERPAVQFTDDEMSLTFDFAV